VSNDVFDIYQMRVESARMQGEMPEYVRDVGQLLDIVRYQQHVLEAYDGRITAVKGRLASLEQQAGWKDTAESKQRDHELMLVGARRLWEAFAQGTSDDRG